MATDSSLSVCVHGLGHIGLPTAAILADNGYNVFGYDVDEDRRLAIRQHEVGFDEAELNAFVERTLDENLCVVSNPVAAGFHLVCVPTPCDHETDQTDLTYVESAAEEIAGPLRPSDAVVLESTVPPGTTEELVAETLRVAGLDVEGELTVAYSPGTVLPENTLTELRENDRIVGGVAGYNCSCVVSLYNSFVSETSGRQTRPQPSS